MNHHINKYEGNRYEPAFPLWDAAQEREPQPAPYVPIVKWTSKGDVVDWIPDSTPVIKCTPLVKGPGVASEKLLVTPHGDVFRKLAGFMTGLVPVSGTEAQEARKRAGLSRDTQPRISAIKEAWVPKLPDLLALYQRFFSTEKRELLLRIGINREGKGKYGRWMFACPKQWGSMGGVETDDPDTNRMLLAEGYDPIGTIHSHPSGGAEASEVDRANWATRAWWGLHLIIGRPNKRAKEQQVVLYGAAYGLVFRLRSFNLWGVKANPKRNYYYCKGTGGKKALCLVGPRKKHITVTPADDFDWCTRYVYGRRSGKGWIPPSDERWWGPSPSSTSAPSLGGKHPWDLDLIMRQGKPVLVERPLNLSAGEEPLLGEYATEAEEMLAQRLQEIWRQTNHDITEAYLDHSERIGGAR